MKNKPEDGVNSSGQKGMTVDMAQADQVPGLMVSVLSLATGGYAALTIEDEKWDNHGTKFTAACGKYLFLEEQT